jgi:hypothetical protein
MAERVENGLGSGTPDVFYCINGVGGWIENKYRERPPMRDTTVVFPSPAGKGPGLRKEQIAWWMQYAKHGGVGAIVAGVGSDTWWFKPSPELLRAFNHLTWAQFNSCARWHLVDRAGENLLAQLRGGTRCVVK